jgi:hypothetical protein
MDENVNENWQWMNFFMNIFNKFCFSKNWTKETWYKKFMLVYCEQFITWNVRVILELIFHYLALQHPSNIKFEITSNSMAHKHVDPPRGMCQFKQYLFSTKRYVTIRNWNNIKHPKTPYHFKVILIFIHFFNPLDTCTMKLHSFSFY